MNILEEAYDGSMKNAPVSRRRSTDQAKVAVQANYQMAHCT